MNDKPESADAVDPQATSHPCPSTREKDLLSQLTAIQGERDQLKAEAALYDNAQCITCKKHLDIEAENEAEKTYTSQLLKRAESAEAELSTVREALTAIVDTDFLKVDGVRQPIWVRWNHALALAKAALHTGDKGVA